LPEKTREERRGEEERRSKRTDGAKRTRTFIAKIPMEYVAIKGCISIKLENAKKILRRGSEQMKREGERVREREREGEKRLR
jgi:hypothetical protein